MFQIEAYREADGGWYFDDAARGLQREALVSGADEVLDRAAAEFAAGGKRIDRLRVSFSHAYDDAIRRLYRESRAATRAETSPFFLYMRRKDGPDVQGTTGTWYDAGEYDTALKPTGTNGVWLCPSLFLYFHFLAPERLFVFIAPV